jgi:4,5-DOPA dioxygenase extradiol
MDRRRFLGLTLAAAAAACKTRRAMRDEPRPSPDRTPVVFVGHGSPMNAIDDTAWSRGWRALGEALPAASAILAVSAHWYVDGTFLTGNDAPPTIHDFGGFPRPLYEVEYPARGDRGLADRVRGLLASRGAALRDDWGLDHGTWSVLVHSRPAADLPVVQLSIDRRLPPVEHLAIGRALAPLRDDGVLILGTGNVTHNLRDFFRQLQAGDTSTAPWAATFDAEVARAAAQHDGAFLARVVATDAGRLAHPTLDHYLPLLYAAGAASDGDPVSFPVTGFEGSLSMRAIRYG